MNIRHSLVVSNKWTQANFSKKGIYGRACGAHRIKAAILEILEAGTSGQHLGVLHQQEFRESTFQKGHG